ncbi:hypothetical protein DFQ11_107106 [Winogradskyella epiphytica]|uniref:Uncharacterized protein n=2 Tax=Winogradskyella epiphytica TaxID=262005 RepID=A0A2V4XWY2_9FLAO|nr:hypothetical protein DFQ11_107106 [Winogradskyella epiphytica]
MDNNYSNYSNADNGKGIVLRIANDDIIISGMFFYDNNGNTAHLSDGSEDHDEVSHIILTINPPSTDAQNSLSGTVNLSNVKFAFQNPEGGAVG